MYLCAFFFSSPIEDKTFPGLKSSVEQTINICVQNHMSQNFLDAGKLRISRKAVHPILAMTQFHHIFIMKKAGDHFDVYELTHDCT